MSPGLRHLSTLLDSIQGIWGHSLDYSVLFHIQVGIQGKGWLTGSCLVPWTVLGRLSQGHCLWMNHQTSPLSVFFVIWTLANGDGLDPEQLAWLGMMSFFQDDGCGHLVSGLGDQWLFHLCLVLPAVLKRLILLPAFCSLNFLIFSLVWVLWGWVELHVLVQEQTSRGPSEVQVLF